MSSFQPLRSLAGREIPFGRLRDWVVQNPETFVVGLGCVFRLAQYLANRTYWLDENSLASSIENLRKTGFFAKLSGTQLAPSGFLAVEWVLGWLFGDRALVLRFFPLVSGIVALLLFRMLADRWLEPRAALVAVALFAFSDELIYFTSELKPYATDVAAAVVCYVVTDGYLKRRDTRAFIHFALFGAAVVWFSFPSVFVLAGIGTVLLCDALRKRDFQQLRKLSLVGMTWVTSFAAVFLMTRYHLDGSRDMWAFWEFAFPPRTLTSLRDAAWVFFRGAYLFRNPLSFSSPLGAGLTATFAMILFLLGGYSLGRNEPRLLALLVSPMVMTFLAAYLRLYPFHGRLVLFLTPMLLLLVAEGTNGLGKRAKTPLFWGAILILFLYPSCFAVYHLMEPRQHNEFNPRGDRRPAALDPVHFPF